MDRLIFFSDYLEKRYGKKLYRIPVDLSLGCPNRKNGGYGEGCAFCSENGGLARHLSRNLNLPEQVERGVKFAAERYGAAPPYIAYFQSFTGTNAPAPTLEKLYNEALALADFRAAIISTRPDALPDDVLELLRDLSRRCELWVELGVQTAHDRTLDLLNRRHTFAQTSDAARRLAAAGINAAAHLIIGLPGESEADNLETARKVAALPFKAVKFHQLMLLAHTPLAGMAARTPGLVTPLNEYAYAEILRKMLRLLPDDTLIMRLAADAPPEELIAPRWWMSKGRFLEFFRREFEHPSVFPGVVTADGSVTLYHPRYRQHFHTLAGARSEARKKFIEASGLAGGEGEVEVLDVGFGLGVNALETMRATGGRARITSLELDPRTLEAAIQIAADADAAAVLEELKAAGRSGNLQLMFGDARQTVRSLPEGAFHYIWLDGFSPEVNPELWTLDFLKLLARRLAPSGVLATYSCSRPVRGALLKLGLRVGESAPFGRKNGGTVASPDPAKIAAPLPEKELNIILHSTAGTPLRDPSLTAAAGEILERHSRTVHRLRRLGVPKWFREKPL